MKRYIFLIGFLLLAIGCTKLVPGTQTLYPSANDLAKIKGICAAAQACMGVDPSIPMPNVALNNSNAVMCNGEVKRGCYHDGTILLPQDSNFNTVAHECVHYYCDKALSFGDDVSHKCPFYNKCAGLITE